MKANPARHDDHETAARYFIDSVLFSFAASHRNLFQAALHLFQNHLSSEHPHT